MIDLKISKWMKILMPTGDVRKATKATVKKYNAMSIEVKVKFEQELDAIILSAKRLTKAEIERELYRREQEQYSDVN